MLVNVCSFVFESTKTRANEMTQQVKCLLHKSNDLSSIHRTHRKVARELSADRLIQGFPKILMNGEKM